MVKTRISPKPTLIVDWIKRLSMLTGEIIPLFMVSPFSTSGVPDFPRTTIQKLRAEAAHILPEAFDLHPNLLHLLETKFRTEKPRNHLHRRSCNIPRTKHKECTEEYSDRWRNACFACTCSSNQKKWISPCFLGKSKSFNFILGFVTQQHPKPVFSF